jgi:hypothetical protein
MNTRVWGIGGIILTGKTEILGEKRVTFFALSPTNPPRTSLGSNQRFRNKEPQINRLSPGGQEQSRVLPEVTNKFYGVCVPGLLVCWPRFELGTPKIRSINAAVSAARIGPEFHVLSFLSEHAVCLYCPCHPTGSTRVLAVKQRGCKP